jgi:hypothetical protein
MTLLMLLAFLILHPKKVRYYLERRDPDFEVRLRRVLIVYQEVQLQNAKRAAGQVTSSKQELVDRIHLYFQQINADPVVFRWKYKMDETNIV